ncbi:adenosine deaminase-like protein [Vespa velutina]|uniref:adenosine deaminase-like protein n=1 Tax=Vespa velutina TaxID=202808 RepID=UPI001FB44DBB|nr:adenosine deaminase-like protein [Vespa velutina]
MNLKNFCQKLPKIELHAHLSGSLTLPTLKKIYLMTNTEIMPNAEFMSFEKYVQLQSANNLKECFKLFHVIHSLTISPQAIYIATCDVIREFMEDNVIYLELRSTPRHVEGRMTKKEYIEAMINAICVSKNTYPNIIVKLLISVDRAQDCENAKENCQLAIDYSIQYPDIVKGVDFGGDPVKGKLHYIPLYEARQNGLKVVIHGAEIPNERETFEVLELRPDRLGHGTCIHPNLGGSVVAFDYLCKAQIPVELCLTSNIKCGTVRSYEDHQFKYLYQTGHPICICTDDKGMYNTTLSKEFEIITKTFDLKKKDLVNICKSSIESSFASTNEKLRLFSILNDFDKKGKTLSKHP